AITAVGDIGVDSLAIWFADTTEQDWFELGHDNLAKPQGLLAEFLDQPFNTIGANIHPMLVIDQHAWRALAGSQTLAELDGDLAVGTGAAGLHPYFFANVLQEFLAAAEHAWQGTADPEARLAQRFLLITKETVEAHRVVDLGRRKVEHVRNLAHGFQRHAAQGILDKVQGR